MSAKLDRENVIVALTEGIGVHFGRASRKSFFKQLERLEGLEAFRQSSPPERQLLIDLLALASFYQSVIVPIHSSARFVSVLHKAGATHLRVAGEKLGRRHAAGASLTTRAFHTVLSQAEIPGHLLTYSTLTKFVRSAREFMKERK